MKVGFPSIIPGWSPSSPPPSKLVVSPFSIHLGLSTLELPMLKSDSSFVNGVPRTL